MLLVVTTLTKGCSINYSVGDEREKKILVGGELFVKCFLEDGRKTNLCFPLGGRVSH